MRGILLHVGWRAIGFAFFFAYCRLSAKPSANVCGPATKRRSKLDLQPVSVFRNVVARRAQGMPGFNHPRKSISLRATTFEEASFTRNLQLDQSGGTFRFFYITPVTQHATREFLREFLEKTSKTFLFISLYVHRISITHPSGLMIHFQGTVWIQPVAIFFSTIKYQINELIFYQFKTYGNDF